MIDSTHTSRPAAAPNLPSASTPLAAPAPGTTPAAGSLLPYVPPAIIFRTPLEAVAASCYSAPGKADLISCLVGNS